MQNTSGLAVVRVARVLNAPIPGIPSYQGVPESGPRFLTEHEVHGHARQVGSAAQWVTGSAQVATATLAVDSLAECSATSSAPGPVGDDARTSVAPASPAPSLLADFVCSVQPGAADGVAFDGGDHVIEGEAGCQAGGLVEGEELEGVGVGPV
jgi:hypothetical protein